MMGLFLFMGELKAKSYFGNFREITEAEPSFGQTVYKC